MRDGHQLHQLQDAGEGEQPAVGVVDELFADLSWLEKRAPIPNGVRSKPDPCWM